MALVDRGRCPNHLARLILLIQQDHDWFVRRQLSINIAGIRADNQYVSDGRLSGRGAVQRNLPRTAFAPDRVGTESLSIGDVVEFDVLVRQDSREFQQFFIDAARSLIIEASLSDARGGVWLAAWFLSK